MNGKPLSWDSFARPDEPLSLFQAIQNDRTLREDRKTLIPVRPPVAVVTERDGEAHRLEVYEGVNALRLTADIRSLLLENARMPPWMEQEPDAASPTTYFEQAFDL